MNATTGSPAPVLGARRRGTRKMSKKVKAMLKKMKLMGGDPMQIEGDGTEMEVEDGGRRRRRRTRRRRFHRRHAGMFA